jgi:hypothetical protein
MVLAKSDGPWRDYWEAVCVEKTGDILTLRWHDEATLAPIARLRYDLVLIYPDAS